MREISTKDYLDDSLRPYSSQSNIRGIPFIGDGFKESQRKALWGIMSRGENAAEDTVERIAAAACAVTDYHHGANSMEGTISNMVQTFPGSNNLTFLAEEGQFGSRKNHTPSQPRYLTTTLDKNFRRIFEKEDDLIFEQIISNNKAVEPKFFIPKIPLILINGADGMGTGHSTHILAYNPKDIKRDILRVLAGEELVRGSLIPWYNGYAGKITRNITTKQVSIEGVFTLEKKGRNHILTITELPIGIQGDNYKKFLDGLEEKEIIIDYDNMSDKNGFEFVIKLSKETAEKTEDEIKKLFKLVSRDTENLTVWNGDGKLYRYDHTEDLLMDWVVWRIDQYEVRLSALISKVKNDIAWANERYRWIQTYLQNVEFFKNSDDAQIFKFMSEQKFNRPDDLLSMAMRSLTKERMAKLQAEVEALQRQLDGLQSTTSIDLMTKEIKEFKV